MKEEILEELRKTFTEQDPDKAKELTKKALDAGISPMEALKEGCLKGLEDMEKRFTYSEGAFGKAEVGDMFLTDLIWAAECLNASMEYLKPAFAASTEKGEFTGKVVIGVVAGDIHDIGKGLVISMLQAAGFEVIDLGYDVPAEKFVEAVKEHNPDLVGTSNALVTVKREIGRVNELLKKEGLRDKVKCMMGGQAIGPEEYKKWGFDAYGKDCIAAREKAEEFMRILKEERGG